MKFSCYLLGLIMGFAISFGFTWSYFSHFNSYAGFGITALLPAVIIGICFYGSDAKWSI